MDIKTLGERAKLKAKAEFAREMADLYEKAVATGYYNRMGAVTAISSMIAALRNAADVNDGRAKILDQDWNAI